MKTNIRPDRSRVTLYLRAVANRIRTWAYFRLKCPWAKRRGFVRIPWGTRIWSPNHDVSFGNRVQFGPECVVHCDASFGDDVLIANRVAFVGRDDHRYDIVGKTIWDSPRDTWSKVVVESDVWIGFGAIVLSGVQIGRGDRCGRRVRRDRGRTAVCDCRGRAGTGNKEPFRSSADSRARAGAGNR